MRKLRKKKDDNLICLQEDNLQTSSNCFNISTCKQKRVFSHSSLLSNWNCDLSGGIYHQKLEEKFNSSVGKQKQKKEFPNNANGHFDKSQKIKVLPAPMAHRAAPISVSLALGRASAHAVRATAGGWSTGSSACLTSPLLSHLSSARREGREYHF